MLSELVLSEAWVGMSELGREIASGWCVDRRHERGRMDPAVNLICCENKSLRVQRSSTQAEDGRPATCGTDDMNSITISTRRCGKQSCAPETMHPDKATEASGPSAPTSEPGDLR